MKEQGYKHKPKTLPKYISKEEILNILNLAKKHRYRNYIMLLTLWRTGLRVSELVNLQKQDIDINEGTIFVRQGKFSKDRNIPLESELGNLLGLYIDRLHYRDKLFSMSDRQVRNIVYKYRPEHLDVHPHTFRHSFAVHCLKKGMNLRSLQKILGHTSLATTQVYLDVIGKDVADDFGKVEW